MPHSPLNPFELPDDPGAGYRALVDMVAQIDTMSNLLVLYGFLQGINLLMLMARVMKMLKFQPRLALVTNTFASGSVDLAHFFSVFMARGVFSTHTPEPTFLLFLRASSPKALTWSAFITPFRHIEQTDPELGHISRLYRGALF